MGLQKENNNFTWRSLADTILIKVNNINKGKNINDTSLDRMQ